MGRWLVDELAKEDLTLAGRSRPEELGYRYLFLNFEEIMERPPSLSGFDAVIHCAALVHQTDASNAPDDSAYFRVNAQATKELAELSASSDVKHFIFLSSVKVNGESTEDKLAYTSVDERRPEGPYALSKAIAEQHLLELAGRSNMRVSIIRPPLIYGPGVKANFASLVKLEKFRLPFLTPKNPGKRSLVSIWNLTSLIGHLLENMPDHSLVYMVSDGTDCTTSEILQYMAEASGRSYYYFSLPTSVLRIIFYSIGRKSMYDKLYGSLQIDMRDTLDRLAWRPLHGTKEGIRKLLHS